MFDALLSLPALYLFSTGYTSWSTSLNILFFYMTWSTLLLSQPPLRVEILGTLAVRAVFFWAPALLFALVDAAVPTLAESVKLQGARGLGGDRGKTKALNRARVMGWGLLNMLMGLAIQAAVELVLVDVAGARSALKISSRLPLPGEIVWDLARGFLVREVLQYYTHRFVLHEGASAAAREHKLWQHGTRAPWSPVAHYDHPVPYLLLRFLPSYLPAIALRYHLLTWFLFTGLCSIEEVTTHSGYKGVYSLLGGATRRVDLHFASKGDVNYAPWGLMDWVHGTSLGSELKDDVKHEYAEHQEKKRRSSRRLIRRKSPK